MAAPWAPDRQTSSSCPAGTSLTPVPLPHACTSSTLVVSCWRFPSGNGQMQSIVCGLRIQVGIALNQPHQHINAGVIEPAVVAVLGGGYPAPRAGGHIVRVEVKPRAAESAAVGIVSWCVDERCVQPEFSGIRLKLAVPSKNIRQGRGGDKGEGINLSQTLCKDD